MASREITCSAGTPTPPALLPPFRNTSHLPLLDLQGFDKASAVWLLKDFLVTHRPSPSSLGLTGSALEATTTVKVVTAKRSKWTTAEPQVLSVHNAVKKYLKENQLAFTSKRPGCLLVQMPPLVEPEESPHVGKGVSRTIRYDGETPRRNRPAEHKDSHNSPKPKAGAPASAPVDASIDEPQQQESLVLVPISRRRRRRNQEQERHHVKSTGVATASSVSTPGTEVRKHVREMKDASKRRLKRRSSSQENEEVVRPKSQNPPPGTAKRESSRADASSLQLGLKTHVITSKKNQESRTPPPILVDHVQAYDGCSSSWQETMFYRSSTTCSDQTPPPLLTTTSCHHPSLDSATLAGGRYPRSHSDEEQHMLQEALKLSIRAAF